MKLYRFLTGSNDSSFCKRVSEALSNGWDLQGSATLVHDPVTGNMMCGQAVTKEVEGEFSYELKLSDF
ncbi:MAG: hypothetical protein COA52_05585 [Hyphomicrobiales bacterium]|nr:DUF1737 domain-containing protein [Hyphomicrobiales bacterium]PCJ94326.1 MAG: hypothetical protein COA52_05585 [Hyphomicrobiales bacterium]